MKLLPIALLALVGFSSEVRAQFYSVQIEHAVETPTS